jgi:hypothetical protein
MGEATALTVVRSTDHLTGTAGRAIITSVTRATDRARRAPGQVGALTISNLRINDRSRESEAHHLGSGNRARIGFIRWICVQPGAAALRLPSALPESLGASPRSSRREFVVPPPPQHCRMTPSTETARSHPLKEAPPGLAPAALRVSPSPGPPFAPPTAPGHTNRSRRGAIRLIYRGCDSHRLTAACSRLHRPLVPGAIRPSDEIAELAQQAREVWLYSKRHEWHWHNHPSFSKILHPKRIKLAFADEIALKQWQRELNAIIVQATAKHPMGSNNDC